MAKDLLANPLDNTFKQRDELRRNEQAQVLAQREKRTLQRHLRWAAKSGDMKRIQTSLLGLGADGKNNEGIITEAMAAPRIVDAMEERDKASIVLNNVANEKNKAKEIEFGQEQRAKGEEVFLKKLADPLALSGGADSLSNALEEGSKLGMNESQVRAAFEKSHGGNKAASVFGKGIPNFGSLDVPVAGPLTKLSSDPVVDTKVKDGFLKSWQSPTSADQPIDTSPFIAKKYPEITGPGGSGYPGMFPDETPKEAPKPQLAQSTEAKAKIANEEERKRRVAGNLFDYQKADRFSLEREKAFRALQDDQTIKTPVEAARFDVERVASNLASAGSKVGETAGKILGGILDVSNPTNYLPWIARKVLPGKTGDYLRASHEQELAMQAAAKRSVDDARAKERLAFVEKTINEQADLLKNF